MRTNLSAPILKIIHILQGTKAAKPTKPAASDLPVPAEGVRNIKSMWEKGNVFSSPTASGTPNKVSKGCCVFILEVGSPPPAPTPPPFFPLFFSFRNYIVNYKSSEESIILTFFCNDHKSKVRKSVFLRFIYYGM